MNSMIFRLGMISFFGDLSSEMLYPITPIFITGVLGASMASLGLIEGTAEAISNILKVYSGSWSDRIQKRKPFIVVGYIFASIAKPLTGLATIWPHVLLARSLDRVGKGLRTAPRDAMLSESVTPSLRGHAFGLHRAMDTTGAAIGPLIAILFLTYYQGELRMIYFIAFIPGMISVLLALSIRETSLQMPKAQKVGWTWKGLSRPFKNYLLAWTIFSLTNSTDVFLLLRVKEAGGSMTVTILLYVFYNLLYASLSPYFGKRSDRTPRKNILFFGLLVFSVVYLGFSFATKIWQFWLLFGLYGIYMAATEGVGKALAVDLFDSRLKATAIGILGTATGLATVLASTIAGVIWDHWGSAWTFIYTASGSMIGAIILYFAVKKEGVTA